MVTFTLSKILTFFYATIDISSLNTLSLDYSELFMPPFKEVGLYWFANVGLLVGQSVVSVDLTLSGW